MNVSFAPLRQDAIDYLTVHVGIDYSDGGLFMPPRWFCVTARDDNGVIMGVLACEFVSWFEAIFNTAITNPRCMSRRLLVALFTALFSKAVRLTAQVDVNNARAIRQMGRMGFVHEGLCRHGINGVRDAYTFGMLREDCRYLLRITGDLPRMREPFHGQHTETA